MKPLRLYAIRKATESAHIEGMYFSDQGIARNIRDSLMTETGEQHVVCPGPDHKRYKPPIKIWVDASESPSNEQVAHYVEECRKLSLA